MKLLIYIHSLENGGAERVAANLANHWSAAGWEVTIVTAAGCRSDFYALDPTVRRVGLDLTGTGRNLVSGCLRLVRRVRGLRAILRATRPDVAISVMHTANVVLALAAHGLPRLLTIGSEHNFPPTAWMGTVWETLRRHAYAHLDAVVALTPECAAWLRIHSLARRIPVIPNAVCWPLRGHEPRFDPETCCRSGRRILLAAGRLSVEKNFAALVDVFTHLAPSHPEWDLVIAGEGPLRADLLARVAAAGLEHRVMLPGRIGNMADWYARADLYAMTSLYEGFPNTLLEALASGLPVVSVDCDTGPRDIVRHGIDGLLVAPADPAALQRSLATLMDDQALRTVFSRRAVEARERFSIDRVVEMWETLFQQLSSQAPGLQHAATFHRMP